MSNRLDSKLFGNLNSEIRDFLHTDRVLLPVIIALGPKFAKKVRPEHLKFLLDHKEMIPMVIKTGGASAWVILEGFNKLQMPYIGPFME